MICEKQTLYLCLMLRKDRVWGWQSRSDQSTLKFYSERRTAMAHTIKTRMQILTRKKKSKIKQKSVLVAVEKLFYVFNIHDRRWRFGLWVGQLARVYVKWKDSTNKLTRERSMKTFRALSNDKRKMKKKHNWRKKLKETIGKEKSVGEEDPAREVMISFAKWIFFGWRERFPQLSEYLLLMAACKSNKR